MGPLAYYMADDFFIPNPPLIVWHEYSMLKHIFNKDDIFFFENKN